MAVADADLARANDGLTICDIDGIVAPTLRSKLRESQEAG
jgi:hypothetical protein